MKKVALVFGGPSAEHDVSLVSAKNIYQALRESDLEVVLLGVTHTKEWKLIEPETLLSTSFEAPIQLQTHGELVDLQSLAVDIVFPIVHGPYGEDGELQKELEALNIPYVGTRVEGCDLAFDKAKTKECITAQNIKQVPSLIIESSDPGYSTVQAKLGDVVFVKPANMGSSVGISKVTNSEQWPVAFQEAKKYDEKIVVEKAISAREIECAILEKDEILVSGCGEIIPNHEWYSYDAKYIDPNGAQLVIPASLTQDQLQEIQSTAKKAFQALKCRGYARADFFIDKNDQTIYFNEINTHPGFTNISMFPQLWQKEGVTYADLIVQMLEQALKDYA